MNYLINKNIHLKKLDNYFEKNSKIYFLYKKLEDYKKRSPQIIEKNFFEKFIVYEKQWKEYVKYEKINIYGIEFVGIGETIPRLFMYMDHIEQNEKGEYNIVLPTFFDFYKKGIFNRSIFEIFKEKINFIKEKDIDFWKYVVLFHSDKINIDKFDLCKNKEVRTIHVELGKPLLEFSQEMEIYCSRKLKEMGVKGEYICVHAREVATKIKNFSDIYLDTSCEDTKLSLLTNACHYLRQQKYSLVRMGKDEEIKCDIEGVIDYANDYYDEKLDFYLVAKCKFYIGSSAGLTAVPSYYGRPILLINANDMSFGFEYMSVLDNNLYIPNKFYSKSKKRLLNLYEMLIVSCKCNRYNEKYNKIGIEIIKDTEEEILEAVMEMDQKLNGTWKVTEEEQEYMAKYWKIIDLWKRKHKFAPTRRILGAEGYTMNPMPICFSYLKRNLYLLDVDGIE